MRLLHRVAPLHGSMRLTAERGFIVWVFCLSFSAKDCGPLRAPVNGTSIGNVSTFPNKVSFQCDAGFILKGSALRQCQANGLWTGNETTCNGKSETSSTQANKLYLYRPE